MPLELRLGFISALYEFFPEMQIVWRIFVPSVSIYVGISGRWHTRNDAFCLPKGPE